MNITSFDNPIYWEVNFALNLNFFFPAFDHKFLLLVLLYLLILVRVLLELVRIYCM